MLDAADDAFVDGHPGRDARRLPRRAELVHHRVVAVPSPPARRAGRRGHPRNAAPRRLTGRSSTELRHQPGLARYTLFSVGHVTPDWESRGKHMARLVIRGRDGRRRHRRHAPRPADVLVVDGRIAEVGPSRSTPPAQRSSTPAARTWRPASSTCHTHLDPSLFWDPCCDPLPQHGVTTVLIGNCSLGLGADAPGPNRRGLEDVLLHRGHPADSFDAGIPWAWETLPRVPRLPWATAASACTRRR